MKRPITKSEYIIGAFFALFAFLPFATVVDGYTIEVLPAVAAVSPSVIEHLETVDDTVTVFELGAMLR